VTEREGKMAKGKNGTVMQGKTARQKGKRGRPKAMRSEGGEKKRRMTIIVPMTKRKEWPRNLGHIKPFPGGESAKGRARNWGKVKEGGRKADQ